MASSANELRRVAMGLRFVSLSLMFLVFYMVGVIVVATTLFDLTKTREAMLHALNQDHPTAVVILITLAVSTMVLDITGKVYCLGVPGGSGAFPLIVMSTIASVMGLAMNLASQLPNLGEFATDLQGSSIVFTFVGYFFFLRFLRQLSAFLKSRRLQSRARMVQISSLLLLGLGLIAGLSGGNNTISAIVILMIAVSGVILFGFYTHLILNLRHSTEAAADSIEESEEA